MKFIRTKHILDKYLCKNSSFLHRIGIKKRRKSCTHVSETVPVFVLTAVPGDGWQPLLVFHKIPGSSCLFPTFDVHLERDAQQQRKASCCSQADHAAQEVEGGDRVWFGMPSVLLQPLIHMQYGCCCLHGLNGRRGRGGGQARREEEEEEERKSLGGREERQRGGKVKGEIRSYTNPLDLFQSHHHYSLKVLSHCR